MNITILNVTQETKMNKMGKPFQQLDIAFKNNTFGGKVEGKKLLGFGAQKAAFETLVVAQPGEQFEVTVNKNDAGFNDWVQVSKSGGGAAVPGMQAPVTNVSNGSRAAPVASRGFETPEERAKKQVYIIRQSSLSTAAATLAISPAKVGPSADAVIEMAKKFEAYVFGTPGLTGFEDIPDLDPSFNNDPVID